MVGIWPRFYSSFGPEGRPRYITINEVGLKDHVYGLLSVGVSSQGFVVASD